MINGAVTLELPDGWSIPAAENITSNKGNVVVNERTINISGLTILKTDELKITFNNVAVPASIGPYTFITKQKSSANGVLTALGYSPQLYVNSEPGPIAVFSISSELVIAGEVLTLDASRSFHSEPDHSIVRDEWDYDCPMGRPVDFHIQSQGQEVQHRFDQAGTFTIVLKAVDDTGKASYALKTVYVDIVNVPSADPGGSYEISRGNELILDGSKSTDPDIYYGDCITKYSWDINGDGIFDIITDQAQANVSWADLQTICGLPSNFSNNYTFTVILEVTDCTDRTAESQTTLTITNTVDGCFIATASFGSKLEPAVVLLRQFRDKCLLTNVWGQKFVKFYYHHSPPIAGLIAGSEPLRIFFRVLLLPFIAIAYTALHPCLIIWAVCLIIFLGLYRLITRTSGH
jgi:hypothetical protein